MFCFTRRNLKWAEFLRGKLRAAMPNSSADYQFLFLNGGSESIDAVAKLALKATGKSHFISFDGAFPRPDTVGDRAFALEDAAMEGLRSDRLRAAAVYTSRAPPRMDVNAEGLRSAAQRA